MAEKKYDWVSLEVEYRTGDAESLSDFFRQKEIPQSTWQKKTKGWLENRSNHLKQIAEATAKKAITRRSTQIANMIEDSDLLRKVAGDYLKGGKARIANARDAAAIIKISHDVNVEALGLEDPMSRLEGLLGASVTLTQGKGTDEVKTEIKLIAGNIARGRVLGLGTGGAVLGSSEHPDGEQPTV